LFSLAISIPALKADRLQAPGSGWIMTPTPPRTLKTLYWKQANQTEVWVQFAPRSPQGETIPAALIFVVLFSGDVTRTGAISGPPNELTVQAQASAQAFHVVPTLKFVPSGGREIDLTSPSSSFSTGMSCAGCGVTSVRATLDAKVLQTLAGSASMSAEVLGMRCELDRADMVALTKFAQFVHVMEPPPSSARPWSSAL